MKTGGSQYLAHRECFRKSSSSSRRVSGEYRKAPSQHTVPLVPNGVGVHSRPSKLSVVSPMSLAGRAHLWNFCLSAVKSTRGVRWEMCTLASRGPASLTSWLQDTCEPAFPQCTLRATPTPSSATPALTPCCGSGQRGALRNPRPPRQFP